MFASKTKLEIAPEVYRAIPSAQEEEQASKVSPMHAVRCASSPPRRPVQAVRRATET
jgi:hypothetical protein